MPVMGSGRYGQECGRREGRPAHGQAEEGKCPFKGPQNDRQERGPEPGGPSRLSPPLADVESGLLGTSEGLHQLIFPGEDIAHQWPSAVGHA